MQKTMLLHGNNFVELSVVLVFRKMSSFFHHFVLQMYFSIWSPCNKELPTSGLPISSLIHMFNDSSVATTFYLTLVQNAFWHWYKYLYCLCKDDELILKEQLLNCHKLIFFYYFMQLMMQHVSFLFLNKYLDDMLLFKKILAVFSLFTQTVILHNNYTWTSSLMFLAALAQMVACLPLVQRVQGSIPARS